MCPVSLTEIQSILSMSKNDKSLGPYGIPVEVYRTLLDVLGLDLLRVIEDSRKCGEIPTVFNSIFIALIPKSDSLKSFEYFRPISLCNFSYKIIGKIISTRIRKVLGRYIYLMSSLVFCLGDRFMMLWGSFRRVCILFTVNI